MKTSLLLSLVSSLAFAAEPTAADVLAKYDSIMGPATFESLGEMTATRAKTAPRARTA